jgi:hypothetical protein
VGDGAEQRWGNTGGDSGGGARRNFAEEARYRDSDLGFGSGLVQEVARGTGNPIGGGVKKVRWRPWMAAGGERRRGTFGEVVRHRESKREPVAMVRHLCGTG